MRNLWNFSYFARRYISATHSELCRCVSVSQAKHHVSFPEISFIKKLFALAIAIITLKDATWSSSSQVPRNVEQILHTIFSFPNPFSESEELQSWACSKILLSFLLRFDGHFWPNQQQQKCLQQFDSFWIYTSLFTFYQLLSFNIKSINLIIIVCK